MLFKPRSAFSMQQGAGFLRNHLQVSAVFPPYNALWKCLKRLCGEAKVEPFGFHDIRHTVAKYLNDLQKVGLKKVQQVLRHRRQTTTEIYVEGNYSDTLEAMKLLELTKVKKFG